MILSHRRTLESRYISPRPLRPTGPGPTATRQESPLRHPCVLPSLVRPRCQALPGTARLQPLEPPSRPPPVRLRPSALHTLGIRPTGPRPIRWHSSRPSAPPTVPCPTRPSGPRPTGSLPVGPPGSRRSGLMRVCFPRVTPSDPGPPVRSHASVRPTHPPVSSHVDFPTPARPARSVPVASGPWPSQGFPLSSRPARPTNRLTTNDRGTWY